MAIPIVNTWRGYFQCQHEGLGSSYERVVLNLKLAELRERYKILTCLEVPVFGFTGLSGINSLGLGKSGVQVTLVDDDASRLRMILDSWRQTGEEARGLCLKGFVPLPFKTESFDFSWNFSALWFVPDIEFFLGELVRVTRRAIFICVPNRWGIGFLSQKHLSGTHLRGLLREWNIIPSNIIRLMASRGWTLVETDYIDAPPWPDIGMKKEELLRHLGLGDLMRRQASYQPSPLTIMAYYRGEDPGFPARVLRHYWFEQKAPRFVKAVWAHHRYLLFEPSSSGNTALA